MEKKKWIAIARETLKMDDGKVAFIKDKPYKVLNRSEYTATLINEQDNSFSIGSGGWYDRFQFVEVPREKGTITFEVVKMEPALYKELIDMVAERIARELSESLVTSSVAPKFRDGDFYASVNGSFVAISNGKISENGDMHRHASLVGNNFVYIEDGCEDRFCGNIDSVTLATPEQKQKLINALAKEGKRWNAEAKRIEDLEWEPKIGEVVKSEPTVDGQHFLFIYNGDSPSGEKLGLGNMFFYQDTVNESKYGGRISYEVRPTTPEERGEFFEALTKAGWKYNSKKVELKKVEKPAIKGFDFSKLKRGDFISYKLQSGHEWFSVVKKVEYGFLHEIASTGGVRYYFDYRQPIRNIDPTSVKVLNRSI